MESYYSSSEELHQQPRYQIRGNLFSSVVKISFNDFFPCIFLNEKTDNPANNLVNNYLK